MQYLLSKLSELNIKLKVIGDQLHASAPVGTMTKELAALVRQHKQDLIKLISDNSSNIQYEPLPTLIPDPARRFESFPLTAIQHAYWMGRSQNKIELGGVSTHLYFESDVVDLDLMRLESAFNTLIRRHDMLRAIIDNEGVQRVLPEIDHYAISVVDLVSLDEESKTAKIHAVRNSMSHQVRPTNVAPIMEVRASQLDGTRTRLHFSLDMLVLDALSMMVLFREWHTLYLAPDTQLPELKITYRDYAIAEEGLVETRNYSSAKDYWWGIIDNLPPAPQIPLRAQKALGTPPVFTRRRFRMEAEDWQRLQGRAKEIGVTPTGIVLAAFTEVLTLWSTSPHYTLNVTLFNRQPLHADVNHLLGDFTSLMLLEIDHRKGNSFSDRAVQMQKRFMHDLQHRAISGLEVMRELRRRRSAMMEAAMPVVFTGGLVYSGEGNDAGLLESFGPMVYGVSQTPQVSLDHQVMEVNGDLVCNWDCVDEKFAPGMLECLYETFCNLMRQLVVNDELWRKSSVVSLPSSQQEVRACVNATSVENPCAEMLHTLFIKRALQQPDAIAIVTHDGEEFTYGMLLALANDLAEKLIAEGVVPDQCVGIVMDKCWEQIAAALGILIAGAAYVPINASFPEKRRQLLLEQGNCSIIVTQEEIKNSAEFSALENCIAVTRNNKLNYLSEAPIQRQIPSNLAYVLFTSGTTGLPKGVMIEHRNAVNTIFYVNEVLGVTSLDRVLAVSALNFDLSVYDLFGTLCAGGALVIPDAKKLTDPGHWYNLIETYHVSLWNSAPSLMGMLVDHIESLNIPSELLMPSLRMVWMSGDRIPVPLPDRIRPCFPGVRVISLGGPTETSIWSIYYPIDEVGAKWNSIPYGKPLPNQSIHVLNESLAACPDGVTGMIYIGGAGLGRGYLNDEDKTSQSFIFHPDTGERLYNSGDLGRYLADGNVEIIGRSDFQVKIRGYRIELGEISSILTQHTDIKQAVIMPSLAMGEQQIVAYIVAESNLTELGVDSESSFVLSRDFFTGSDFSNSVIANPNDSRLDEFYLWTVSLAFAQLGFNVNGGEKISIVDLGKAGVKSDFFPWCKRAMGHLIHLGFARELDQESIELLKALYDVDAEALYDELSALLLEHGYDDNAANWIAQNARDIGWILQGQVLIEDIHCCGEDILSVTRKLIGSMDEQVEGLIAGIFNKINRPLSVLEVGAGFGALTHMLAPIMKKYAKNFLVTDEAEDNLEFLYDKLESQYDNIEFGLYNFNEPTELQGLEKKSYDLIVACTALQKTLDTESVLSSLRGLLKPGGVLLLLEPAQYIPSYDLHIGLLHGVNAILTTNEINQPSLVLNQYDTYFTRAGFEAGFEIKNGVREGFSLFIAQAPAGIIIDKARVKKYLSSMLPDYMVPHHIIQLDTMPISVNGKVDYKDLPAIDRAGSESAVQVIAPRDDVEQKIYDAWITVLNCATVSVHDDFFFVGGDSLLAAKVVREVNLRIADFNLEVFEFFEYLTIEQLANLYRKRDAEVTGCRKIEEVLTSLNFNSDQIVKDVRNALVEINIPNNFKYIEKTDGAILLTGATGWLGAYVLSDLLNKTSSEICCIGRGVNEASLLSRIKDNLLHYNLILTSSQLQRIKPFVGDLELPSLGLPQATWNYFIDNVNSIYHAAAEIGIAASYSEMRKANLGSVTELAKLAVARNGKKFYFCSSVAVLIQYDGQKFSIHKEESGVPSPDGLITGYAQSKWAAETVLLDLAQKGLPVKIYRIAHVLPDTNTNYAKPNYIFESILAVSRLAGVVPDWEGGKFYGIPVNVASDLLVSSSLRDDKYSGVIHMDNQHPTDFKSLINLMLDIQLKSQSGDLLPLVSFSEWLGHCRRVKNELPIQTQAILNFLLEETDSGTMLEVLYNSEASFMNYLNQFNEKSSSAVSDLTPSAYWREYFEKVAFTVD